MLDAACGLGRHSVLAALYGYPVLAVDRDDDFALRASGFPEIEFRKTDLETGSWPLGDELFSGIIVVNYLNRPLFPELVRHLAPGGVLIYQTFTKGARRGEWETRESGSLAEVRRAPHAGFPAHRDGV